jgi:hypothetical protein
MVKPRKEIMLSAFVSFEVIRSIRLLHDNAIVLILNGINSIPYPELKCPMLTLLFTIG